MTPAELKAEILSGPLAGSLAAFVPGGAKHVTGERGLSWAACIAAGLNDRTRPGYVPARWVSVSLAKFPQVDGLVRWTQTLGTMPVELGGGPCQFSLYCLLRNLDRLSQSVDRGDLRAGVAEIQAGLAAAGAAGIVGADKPIPTAFGDYLLSGEVKISRVQEVGGTLSAVVTEADVAKAFAE